MSNAFFCCCCFSSPHSLIKNMDNVSEKNDVKSCPRDSGYDSLSNKLSILDKLLHTHPVWLQLGLNDAEAMEILQAQPPGVRSYIAIYLVQVWKTNQLTRNPNKLTNQHHTPISSVLWTIQVRASLTAGPFAWGVTLETSLGPLELRSRLLQVKL